MPLRVGSQAASFLCSSLLQAISAVVIWHVQVRKFPKTLSTFLPCHSAAVMSAVLVNLCDHSFHLSPARPRQSVHSSIAFAAKNRMAVCPSGLPIPVCIICNRFVELVTMMACMICQSLWIASHYIAWVTGQSGCCNSEHHRFRVVFSLGISPL